MALSTFVTALLFQSVTLLPVSAALQNPQQVIQTEPDALTKVHEECVIESFYHLSK